MVIEGTDFRIYNDGMSCHFDLELMKTVKPRGKPERLEWSDPMYGMPLYRAIEIIANYRLDKKKDTYSLEEYISEFKKQINTLKQLVENYEKND